MAIKRRLSAAKKVPRRQPSPRLVTPETDADLEVGSINKATPETPGVLPVPVPVPTPPKEPPSVDGILNELKKGRSGQRTARQLKSEYHASIKAGAPATDVDIFDFVTPNRPRLPTEAPVTPVASVTAVTPLFEVELLEQVEWVRRHRTQHPETPCLTRLSRCLDLLGKMCRDTKGATAEFLTCLRAEVLDAVFLSEYAQKYFANDTADHTTLSTYHWHFLSLTSREAALETENRHLTSHLKSATSKVDDLERQLDTEGLGLLRKRLEELEMVHNSTVSKLQRQKDHSDFLNGQIDELQDALKKAAERSYSAVRVQHGEKGGRIKELIMQSDSEIHTILGFNDPSFETEGRRKQKRDLHVTTNEVPSFRRSTSSTLSLNAGIKHGESVTKSPRTPTSAGSCDSSFHASEVSLTWQETDSHRGSTQ